MIASFSVSNFYSIRERQSISFIPSKDKLMEDEYCHYVNDKTKLLKIGIIYGSNASGKSNVLKAFEYFRRLMLIIPKDKAERLYHEPFLMDGNSVNKTSEMKMEIYIKGTRHVIDIVFDRYRIYSESIKIYMSNQPTLLYQREYVQESDSTVIKFGNTLKIGKAGQIAILGNTINNCSVMAAFGRSNVSSPLLDRIFKFFLDSMPEVLSPHMTLMDYIHNKIKIDTGGELKRFVLKFLKASDFNISDISVHEEEHIITPEMSGLLNAMPISEEIKKKISNSGKYTSDEMIFSHQTDEGTYEIDEGLESSGTLRYMGIAIILYQLLSKDCFVAIDEIESSIHYELLSYFIRTFLMSSEGESQMLVTTHDINLLDENFIRRDVIWFTDKDEHGTTHIESLASFGLHKNLSPYHAYRQGRLVKLPFTESPYINFDSETVNEKE